jgi:hypothetical protein
MVRQGMKMQHGARSRMACSAFSADELKIELPLAAITISLPGSFGQQSSSASVTPAQVSIAKQAPVIRGMDDGWMDGWSFDLLIRTCDITLIWPHLICTPCSCIMDNK